MRIRRMVAAVVAATATACLPLAATAPATAAPMPAAAVSTTSAVTEAGWSAPKLEANPLVWVPSASSRTFKAPANRDVVISWPKTALDVPGGFELTGGRNVVSRGGLVKPSKRHFPVMVDTPNQNRCLKVSGHSSAQSPRTVHIEGLHCAGEHIWEGINVDSKGERGNLTVQLRNILIDRVNVEYPGGTGKHIGGDALQVWNGPHRLLIDGFTAKNLEYQGMFLQPYQFGTGSLGTWDLRNINLEGDPARSAYILWLAGARSGSGNVIKMTVKNVYVQPGGGRSRSQSLWDAANDWPEVKIGKAPTDFVKL